MLGTNPPQRQRRNVIVLLFVTSGFGISCASGSPPLQVESILSVRARIQEASFADPSASAPAPSERAIDLSDHFTGFDGCFVLYDVKANVYTRYNADRCRQRFSPWSTFKIPNALVGLETGIVRNVDHVFKWDGNRDNRVILNRDHDLRSAMKHSVVWYFQRIAEQVGPERMKQWIDRLKYGNRNVSGGITKFWLKAPLEISPDEQVVFLERLRSGKLPVSERSMDIVRDILVLGEHDGRVFRGKTGSGYVDDEQKIGLGWFVGYVTAADGAYVFATNMQGPGAWGQKAKRITEAILRDLGVLSSASR